MMDPQPPAVAYSAGLALTGGSGYPPKRLLTPSSVIVPSEVGDWTASGDLSISSDTVYYKATGVTNGSIKMTPDGTGTANILSRTDLTPGDMSADTSISLWYYVHEGTPGGVDDCQEIETFKIQFGIPGMAGYQTHELISAAAPDPRVPGWHYYEITPSIWGATSGAGFAWADVTVIRWYLVTSAAAKRPEITVGPVCIFAKRTKGIVCFTFDDQFLVQLPYLAYLAGLGIRATLYVVPNNVGNSGKMTLSQIREVRDMGHLIANHGWNHESLSGLTDAERIESIVKAARWLCDEGFADGARIYAAPNGSGEVVAGVGNLLRPYLDQLRGTVLYSREGAPAPMGYGNYVGADSMYRVFNSCTDNAGSDGATEADMIDRAIADGTICLPLRHETSTDFKTNADTVAAAVTAGTLETMTIADLLDVAKVDLGVTWLMSIPGVSGVGTDALGGSIAGGDQALDLTTTEAAVAYAKAADGGVFVNLSVTQGGAGYAADYQIFPDTELEDDACYFGAALRFCEVYFDVDTVATYGADSVIWEYYNGADWDTELSVATHKLYDYTDSDDQDGDRSFQEDGALVFVPPSDWAAVEVDSQMGYWIRARVKNGFNITQIPILNSVEHKIVTPTDGFKCPEAGTIVGCRLTNGNTTAHTTADILFFLMNFTTGVHSDEMTFAQDKRQERFDGTDFKTGGLGVSAGDVLGVVVTQEDTAQELTNGFLELDVDL